MDKLLYAALLHDADDRKYFEGHVDYENARMLMNGDGLTSEFIEEAIKIIGVVSFSKNGDSLDPTKPSWFYFPRYSDRLEAIGLKGIFRCYQFSKIN